MAKSFNRRECWYINTSTRNENESYISYLKRIIQLVKDDKIGYSEMGDCLLGSKNVYSSENLRKGYYVLQKISDNINGHCVITDNDILKEIVKQNDGL